MYYLRQDWLWDKWQTLILLLVYKFILTKLPMFALQNNRSVDNYKIYTSGK